MSVSSLDYLIFRLSSRVILHVLLTDPLVPCKLPTRFHLFLSPIVVPRDAPELIVAARDFFGGFLSDTAVLHFDTDFKQIYGEIIFIHIICIAKQYCIMEYLFAVSD